MNLPNKISITRLILVPIIVFFYLANFIPWGKFIAMVLFIIAALTDFLDGHIARKYNLITNFGKFMDSIADKVLAMAGLLLIVADGTILAPYGVIMAIIIIAREFLVSGLRMVASSKGVVLAADMFGKIKATITDIFIPVYIFYAWCITDSIITSALALDIIKWVAFAGMILATIATLLSGANYLIKNKKVFKD